MNEPNWRPKTVFKLERAGPPSPAAAILLLVALALLPSGCGLLRAPQKMVTAVVPGSSSKQPDPVQVQVQVQRFTVDYVMRTAQAIDDYARLVGTASARVDALQWKLTSVSAVYSIASGPNPMANMLDLVTVATLTRATIEDYWIKTTNGPAFQSWLEASRHLETNAWEMAVGVLKPAQLDELRKVISQWQARNPDARNALFARPQEFAAMVKTEGAKGADVNSVFSFVGLDPTSGLDPAVREITRSRLFAERAMFTVQSMPYLVRWQAEMLTYQWAGQPAFQLALTNTARLGDNMGRISHGWENVSQVIAQLPDRISAERKAILDALETQEGKLRELGSEVNRALVSADKMSISLNTTLTTFDALMKRFGVGEPDTNAVPATHSAPFNILDYGQVATQVGAMAKEINTLVASVNQSVPQVTRLSQEATVEAQRVVDRAFRFGLVLIGVLLVGSVLAGLGYRVLADKLKRAGPPTPSPNP